MLKRSKCEFFKKKVTFLGSIIFENGHAACPDKLAAIVNWKRPENWTELRSFLGTVNFLCCFAPKLSDAAHPLLVMTSTKIPFIWGVSEENAFLEIKKIMVALPVLALPDSDKPFIVETDASDFAVRAVLLQVGDDNLEHPVAFFSRKMLPAETNYPVHNKEILAIISTLKEWPHYLMNAHYPVVIRSDHKSLEYFKLPQRLSQRQACWHHTLAHYQFKIEYKKGI